MSNVPKKLRESAPEGTVWFGGPIDRTKVCLRIFGDKLNPEEITKHLGIEPTTSYTKGEIIRGNKSNRQTKTGRWSLNSKLDDHIDLEEKIRDIIKPILANESYWETVTTECEVDLFCGLFLEAENRGFDLSSEIIGELGRLSINISFDIYAPD